MYNTVSPWEKVLLFVTKQILGWFLVYCCFLRCFNKNCLNYVIFAANFSMGDLKQNEALWAEGWYELFTNVASVSVLLRWQLDQKRVEYSDCIQIATISETSFTFGYFSGFNKLLHPIKRCYKSIESTWEHGRNKPLRAALLWPFTHIVEILVQWWGMREAPVKINQEHFYQWNLIIRQNELGVNWLHISVFFTPSKLSIENRTSIA